jgi:hypothetical protein
MASGFRLGAVAVALVMAGGLAGCAGTPTAPTGGGVVFVRPIEEAQKAAADALVVLGFDLKTQAPGHVEGSRPRKFGLFVGSGGETVGVWLEAVGPDRTRVRVDTARTFAGYAGQKRWDADVLAQMAKSLGKAE